MSLSLKQIIKSGFTTRQAKVLQGLGGGAVKLSELQFGTFTYYRLAGWQFLAAGGDNVGAALHAEDFTSGVPGWMAGTVQPLTITTGWGDAPHLPDADAVYDVNVEISGTADVDDAGKTFQLRLQGWTTNCFGLGVVRPDGLWSINMQHVEYVTADASGSDLSFGGVTLDLTAPLICTYLGGSVTKR